MKKYLFILGIAVLFAACQEETYISNYQVKAPVLTDFSPKQGEVGTMVTITGENLQRVDTVLIGGTPALIRYRISGEKMVAQVVSGNRSGHVRISNVKGSSVSNDEFTVQYAVPSITKCPVEGTVNAEVVVEGDNLHFVEKVIVGSIEAVIIAQQEKELVFKVPYVESEVSVNLQVVYFDGTAYQSSVAQENFTILLEAPAVTYCPLSLTKYTPVTLQGEHLRLVEAMYVGDEPVQIKLQSDEEITFDMPTNYFGGNMTGDLKAIYYGVKQVIFVQDFQVFADPNEPRYYKYTDVLLSARENYGGTEIPFFDCESGSVISSCDGAANMSIIDFLLYDQAGYVQLYGPHNSTNTVKNFKCEGKTIDPQDGTWKPFYDPDNGIITCFRVLKPENPAEKAIIDAYEAGTIIELDDSFFEGVTEPSSKAPRVYKSASENGYSNSHFSLDQYPYGWVRNFTTGKNGIIKVTEMPKDAVNGRIPELKFDIIWSK